MNLTDIGENNRFRFEAGTLPLILAVAVIVSGVRWGMARFPDRHPVGAGGPSPSDRSHRADQVPGHPADTAGIDEMVPEGRSG